MIELYFAPTPNGWKISVMLEECELPYRVFPVNITRGEQLRAEFVKLSPNGRIPAIVDRDPPDGGEAIAMFESGAILRYLAEKAGRLYPADLRARLNVEQWLMWQMAGLGPMLGQNGHFLLYAPQKIPYAIDRYGREASRLYGVLDAQLGRTGAFVAGEYSIADIACFPWIMTHKAQGISLDDTPHLKRWFAEIRARPQVQKGVALGKSKKKTELDSKARESLFGIGAAPMPNPVRVPTDSDIRKST
ncbi:MAG: GSH-dependent disulfide-bond oxidoreductase [Bradyrhizobium sp.]|nr:GSH-dependent disulfide-bond oxidoreductase [Bradyrhizobium sp.]